MLLGQILCRNSKTQDSSVLHNARTNNLTMQQKHSNVKVSSWAIYWSISLLDDPVLRMQFRDIGLDCPGLTTLEWLLHI